MASGRKAAAGKAAAAVAMLLGVPSDYDPEEDDFEDLPPAKPRTSRKRKRRRSAVAVTATAAVIGAAAASSIAGDAPLGLVSRTRRPSTVVAQRRVPPLQRPSPAAVGRTQSSAELGQRVLWPPLPGLLPGGHHNQAPVRQDDRPLVARPARREPLPAAVIRGRQPPVTWRPAAASGRAGRGVPPRPRQQTRPVLFDDMIISGCDALPSDPTARAHEVIRQLAERRESDHQAYLATLDRDLKAYKHARKNPCTVYQQRWEQLHAVIFQRLRVRGRDWRRYSNGLWDLHLTGVGRAGVRERLLAESARERERNSTESARSFDLLQHMRLATYHLADELSTHESSQIPFQTHLGWSQRALRHVGRWVATVASRYTSTNAGRLLVMPPYSELVVGFLTIEEAFNMFAARLNSKWADVFAMKLLRKMDHFDHDCERSMHSLPVKHSSDPVLLSSDRPQAATLIRRAPKDYLDACFLARKNFSQHCGSPLRLSVLSRCQWVDAVVVEYKLQPVAFPLASVADALDDHEVSLGVILRPVVMQEASPVTELLNRHLSSTAGARDFVESRRSSAPRSPIEAHWHAIQLGANGGSSCGYCKQIIAQLPRPPTRPFRRSVDLAMRGVDGCAALLQPLKRTLETLRAQGQVSHVACVRSHLEFPQQSGLLAGVTSAGVVVGVAWRPV